MSNNIVIRDSNFTNNSQAIAFTTTTFTLNNNNITDNGIAVQFVLNNLNYTIAGLSANNNISNNLYAIGISGTGSNYTLADSFGSNNNGGFIFTSSATNNAIVNSNITGYTRSDSQAVFFNDTSNNNTVLQCNITGNVFAVRINGTNNKIFGSNIINNNRGIDIVLGAVNATIQYNRIFNNTGFNTVDLSNVPSTTNADYNWWGNNTPLVSGINLGNYFVMQLSANTFSTIINASTKQLTGLVNLTYELVLFNGTNTSSVVNYGLLPNFNVTVTWMENNVTLVNTTVGNAKGSYSTIVPLTQYNTYTLQAIADNGDIMLFLESDPKVNLTVNKTANVTGNVINGQIIQYTIVVHNYGPDDATGVIVNETLPSTLVYIDHTASFGTHYNPVNGVWNITNLNNGTNVTLVIYVLVNATTNGNPVNVTNSVNITADQDNINNETNGTNITEDIIVVPGVNLTTTKTVNVTGDVVNGQTIQYTIVVTNHGPDNATGVIVNETLSNNLVYVDQIASPGTYYDPGAGKWTIGNLSNGQNVTLIVIVRVNGTGNITNNINVISNENNIGNDESNSTIIVKLRTSSTINVPGNVTIGQTINITGVLTDENGKPISNVKVNVTIDGKTQTVTTNSTGGWTVPYTANRTGNINVVASFAGNENFAGFTSSAVFNVQAKNDTKKIPTFITVKVKGNKIIATLFNKNTGKPIPNETLYLVDKLGRVLGFGVTNANGQVVFTYDGNKAGLQVVFRGSDIYQPSSADVIVKNDSNKTNGNNYPKAISNNANINENTAHSKTSNVSAMKSTGMPFVTAILVLLSSIVMLGYRKKFNN